MDSIRNYVLNEWRNKRFKTAWGLGVIAVMLLDRLIIEVLLPRLSFSPHYTVAHDYLRLFELLVVKQDKVPIQHVMHQIAMYNYLVHLGIAMLVGAACGLLLADKKAYLAASIAVLPIWVHAIIGLIIFSVSAVPQFFFGFENRVDFKSLIIYIGMLLSITAIAILSAFFAQFLINTRRRRLAVQLIG